MKYYFLSIIFYTILLACSKEPGPPKESEPGIIQSPEKFSINLQNPYIDSLQNYSELVIKGIAANQRENVDKEYSLFNEYRKSDAFIKHVNEDKSGVLRRFVDSLSIFVSDRYKDYIMPFEKPKCAIVANEVKELVIQALKSDQPSTIKKAYSKTRSKKVQECYDYQNFRDQVTLYQDQLERKMEHLMN